MNEKEKIIAHKLYDAGATDRAIARILKCSQPTITKWRAGEGLPKQIDADSWWRANSAPGKVSGVKWENFHKEVIAGILAGQFEQ